jgi:hypothetical protein
LFAVADTLKVKRTTDDMVADTWKVRYTATTDKHNGVFLEIVTFTTDVCPNFVTVRQAHAGNLTKG